MNNEYVFTFGKYKGKNLSEVLNISPSYILWCSIQISHFQDMIEKQYPLILKAIKQAGKNLQEEKEAWAYTGGKMPNYDSVFWKTYRNIS
jgi:hypothetical protein